MGKPINQRDLTVERIIKEFPVVQSFFGAIYVVSPQQKVLRKMDFWPDSAGGELPLTDKLLEGITAVRDEKMDWHRVISDCYLIEEGDE